MAAVHPSQDAADIVAALELCRVRGLDLDLLDTSFFVSRERIVPTAGTEGASWRDRLFAAMARNAGSFTDYFNIPSNRVVELGSRVQI
jgi:KUP system potassium uptake protein